MITSTKRFGSYILESASDALKHLEIDDNNTYKSTCTIPSTWVELDLLEIRQYNDDTNIFRFKLPNNEQYLRLPIGAYLLVKAPKCEHGTGDDAIRPYTSISSDKGLGYFEIICKRYKEWGVKEDKLSQNNLFLFIKTDHSYRPQGAVSNYIHNLKIGDKLSFKHTSACKGKIYFPFPDEISTIIMLAVGIGVAPMINILRAIFDVENRDLTKNITNVILLYGVRETKDILLQKVLEDWRVSEPRFRVVYCIGSRWSQVIMGAKTKEEYLPPPLPKGYQELQDAGVPVELGWVNEDKIKRYTPPSSMTSRVIVCGLPSVYDKLCGPRTEEEVKQGSVLQNLGYSKENVIKL